MQLNLFGMAISYLLQGFAYMTSTMSIASANVIPLQHGHALHYLANNVIWIINTGSISIALPIINHLLIPIRPTFNIRLNLSIGFLLHVLSFGAAALIQSKQEQLNDSQFFCLMVVAVVLLSVGETIVFVSSEFN